MPSLYDENLDRSKYNNHGEYVQDIAKYKVYDVYERLKDDPVPPLLIIGADTMATLGNNVYGKPKNEAEAYHMLSRYIIICKLDMILSVVEQKRRTIDFFLSLTNKEHVSYTGVCLKTPKTEVQFYEATKVKIGDVSEAQIREYIKTGDPL